VSSEGNPCHDDKGQFCSGPSTGGGGVATLAQLVASDKGKFTDGPKKMLETKHGWVEPLPKGTQKKVAGGFTGYKVMNSEGVHVGEVWRNPTGSEHTYSAFHPDGTSAGGFEKKVHAVAALSAAAKDKMAATKMTVASSEVVGSLVAEASGLAGLKAQGVHTYPLHVSKAPPKMSNAIEGVEVYDGDGDKKGEVWSAEHKTEKKVKYWTKKAGSDALGKSHETLHGAVDSLTDQVATDTGEKQIHFIANDVKITNSEKKALRYYSSTGYQNINRHLRTEVGTSSSASNSWSTLSSKEAVVARIAHIDAVMARSVVGKTNLHGAMEIGPTLYRGAKVSQFGVKSFADLKVGMELANHAYVSTSRKESVAKSFIHKYKSGNATLLHIRTGPKSHGIDMKGISIHFEEDEVLLPRKSRFRIYKIDGGVVHVEHVDPH